jgi:hypothetical protein
MRSGIVKRQQTITYWEFSIYIVGPRYKTKARRRAIHKALSRRLLRSVERAALQAAKAKLLPGLTATLF